MNQIGAIPEKVIRFIFNLIRRLISLVYHQIKMNRYYNKNRKGQS